MKTIKVVLTKTFDIDLKEVEGKTIDELTDKAVQIAKKKFYKQIATRSAKPLMDGQVVIQNIH